MKGFISEDGCLNIYRRGQARLQICPDRSINRACSDKCPRLGDIVKKDAPYDEYHLNVCGFTLVFEELEDRRKPKKKPTKKEIEEESKCI